MNRSAVVTLGIIVLTMMFLVFHSGALSTFLEAPVFVEESALSSPEYEQEQEVFGGTQANVSVVEGIRYGPVPPYPEGSFGAFLDTLDRELTDLQLEAHTLHLKGETMDWEALLFFSQSHKEELLNLNKGDIIKVRCKYHEMWYGGPHMKDCDLL